MTTIEAPSDPTAVGPGSDRSWPNPLLAGFHPDPSVVKVGEDYYLTSSTFEYLPGLPLFHSRDLVDWRLIGHVVERAGQLAGDVPTNCGAWAPTIRHHDGIFHVAVTDARGRGTVVFTATDPAGPWSDGTVIDGLVGIDPDLAWDDDGVCHITYSAMNVTAGGPTAAHGGIMQVTADLSTGRLLCEPRSLWSGTGLKFPEGPHVYRRGDWWYLLIAEGGTHRGHSISVARGTSPSGPFEGFSGNPILSARSTGRPVQNTGHADLVQTPDGGWAAVLLGTRPRGATREFAPLGRETFLTSARWVDDWLELDPVGLNPGPALDIVDDFRGETLDPEWLGVRRFPTEFSTVGDGGVMIRGGVADLDDPMPSLIGRRQQHTTVHAEAVVEVGAGRGGLAVRFDEHHHYEIEVGAGRVIARAVLSGVRQEWSCPAPASTVTLHLDCLPQPLGSTFLDMVSCDRIVLGVSADGVERVDVAQLDGRYLSLETAAPFAGRLIALFAVDGDVRFRSYRYRGRDT